MSLAADDAVDATGPVPESVRELVGLFEDVGASVVVTVAGHAPVPVGRAPHRARIVIHDARVLDRVRAGDHLRVAEAYLDGRVDVEGDLGEVVRLVERFDMDLPWWERLAVLLRGVLGRRAFRRRSIAFHYDQEPDFFLAWFDRWRSYSHGFYANADDSLETAQSRKLQYAVDALGLRPGMDVFDMGGGWGAFVEYAGLRGIRVHAITISHVQHAFVSKLIRERRLPCTVELVDFFDHRPSRAFDGAVFMGTLEHVGRYGRVSRFLAEHLKPGARFYADFCAQRRSIVPGRFIRRHLWPGAASYVNVQALVRALVEGGLAVHALEDDTLSYACTARDWARRLEAARGPLAARWGEPAVRAFLLFLRCSEYFLATNRTQAYHLVGGTTPAALRA